jgi:hypothetical protein
MNLPRDQRQLPGGHVDGNCLAGAMSDVFGRDITDAMGVCNFCGNRAAVAEVPAYKAGPGVVLRCAECDTILMRWATTPVSTWLEMPGLRSLEIAMQA